jgi:hypothetical protein
VSFAEFGIIWEFVRVGQRHEDHPSPKRLERSSIDASETPEEVCAACFGETPYLIPPPRRIGGLNWLLVLVSSKESVDTDPPTAEVM